MNDLIIDPDNDPATWPRVIYLLYLASIVAGLTAIIGLAMAYVNREDSPDWIKTHYDFQIRTFWIGLLIALIAPPLCLVAIGYGLLAFLYFWLIMRSVKGLKYLGKNMAPSPS